MACLGPILQHLIFQFRYIEDILAIDRVSNLFYYQILVFQSELNYSGFQFCLNSKIHDLVTELVSLKECVPGFTYPRKVLTRMKAKEVKFLWLFVAKKFVTLKGLHSALKCIQE